MDAPRLRSSLLRWFARSKRDLPWRQTRDSYAIWVSEVMLQQTTVAAVIPYYLRFMARFPTMRALAAAREDAVLALWSGLGYYSRARRLWAGARELVRAGRDGFPRDVASALEIKGVGPYTAAAVTSIAYGTRAAVVDGNVRRVLSRLHAAPNLSPRRAHELAADLLSSRSPGRWNEAMMELGATVCLPRAPQCDACPIAAHCRGRSRPEAWGLSRKRPSGIPLKVQMALVVRENKVLLVRNPRRTLLGGLYELPHAGFPGRGRATLAQAYRGQIRIEPRPLATIRHAVTRYRIEALVYVGHPTTMRTGSLGFHPVHELGLLPLGGLTLKALAAAGLPTAQRS